ncbi:MAG: hypothetical protein HQK96_05905 [Nitrospirae bacterium]|nr:hypothetical protein [Nitrospirota bacterium]MBF0554074.1 hypothetical protein [Nitrospirota bacterium]MBF0554080.1 hypothetical protein [Nitrospirota bacterium]
MADTTNSLLEAAEARYNEIDAIISTKNAEIAALRNESNALKAFLGSMGVIKSKRSYNTASKGKRRPKTPTSAATKDSTAK